MSGPTSCPFINTLVKQGDIDAKQVSVVDLVNVAVTQYGVDARLMRFLAKHSADPTSGQITLARFMDPRTFPNHHGALARTDVTLGLDLTRLDALVRFSTHGWISYAQLIAYQEFCWSLSFMTRVKDKLPAMVELELLWSLLGSYQYQGAVPLEVVCNFLRYNELPRPFQPNLSPVSLLGVMGRVLRRCLCCC